MHIPFCSASVLGKCIYIDANVRVETYYKLKGRYKHCNEYNKKKSKSEALSMRGLKPEVKLAQGLNYAPRMKR